MDAVALSSLWLPIVVSAVVVFFASFLAWMVLPHHRKDFGRLPDEDKVADALRGTPPGEYQLPFAATSEDWKSAEWQEKAKRGPVALLAVKPSGAPNMGKSLGQWLVYCLAISFFVAYVASHAVAGGAHYLQVFQIVGTVAFLAYGAAHVTGAIWMGHGWGRATRDLIDGLVYGLLTAGIFGWLWP